jgi:hypothetical protein
MKKLMLPIVLTFIFAIISIPLVALIGEPVPGAEVYIELEPDDEPIINVPTNEEGEFMFEFPPTIPIPKKGSFKMTIVPPSLKKLSQSSTLRTKPMEKTTIVVNFTSKDGPVFKYKIVWNEDIKAENKGAFAVSGKNSTLFSAPSFN